VHKGVDFVLHEVFKELLDKMCYTVFDCTHELDREIIQTPTSSSKINYSSSDQWLQLKSATGTRWAHLMATFIYFYLTRKYYPSSSTRYSLDISIKQNITRTQLSNSSIPLLSPSLPLFSIFSLWFLTKSLKNNEKEYFKKSKNKWN